MIKQEFEQILGYTLLIDPKIFLLYIEVGGKFPYKILSANLLTSASVLKYWKSDIYT